MRHTIRWQIAVPYVILLVAAMTGLGLYLSNTTRQTYEEAWRLNLTADAHLMAAFAGPYLSSSDSTSQTAAASSTLEPLAKNYALLLNCRITFIRSDGMVLGESDTNPSDMENHQYRVEVIQAMTGSDGYQVRYSTTLKKEMLYVAAPIRGENSQVIGVARLSIPLDFIYIKLSNIKTGILAAVLSVTVLAVLLAFLVTNIVTRPLRQLTQSVKQQSTAELKSLIIPAGDNEIGQLGRAIRQMALQLDAQITALTAERGKLAAVLAQMTGAVVIIDAHGLIQLLNPEAEKIFQVNEKTALGRSAVEILRYHQLVELWRRCQESRVQQNATLEISADKIFLQVAAIPLEQSLPGSILFLFQDLTRLRRLETVRRDFVSNVSHELRTPLASLKALTETLQEGALEDPPAARQFLARMDTEIDTLTQMVQELLELSRIESGKVPLQLKPTPPDQLIHLAIERMSLQADRAGLMIKETCPAGLPLVQVDFDRMEQVLGNLLHNAIKFTPPGGEIIVTARKENEWVVFSVADTGVGIAPADLERIFERFYKADRARSGGGTGLGLSIARHLVEAHGGRIWAESRPGNGSTFYFSLPISINKI
jgi:two-component system, OmpR family, phosphate regulon sensor histidine kinase PhoR